ncbi:hypothetical protein [Sphingomonas faeni]|uniref:hypothetical protein n=1 Tax=Sphingomonas faeni TaxID=185950 RepID=UPI003360F429
MNHVPNPGATAFLVEVATDGSEQHIPSATLLLMDAAASIITTQLMHSHPREVAQALSTYLIETVDAAVAAKREV